MGMFDYVVCKMPLPEPCPPSGFVFQTKDTDAQYMETYRIEVDGTLIHETRDYEWDPELKEDGSVKTMAGALKSFNRRDVLVSYHGDINFYGSDHVTGEEWDYVARFTEGRCSRIWLEEHHAATDEAVVYESPPLSAFSDETALKRHALLSARAIGMPVSEDGDRMNCPAWQTKRDDGSWRIVVRKSDCRIPSSTSEPSV